MLVALGLPEARLKTGFFCFENVEIIMIRFNAVADFICFLVSKWVTFVVGNYFIFHVKKSKVMYGGAAYHRQISQMMKEETERVISDPAYRQQVIEELGLEDLFSRMTEEHWRIADAKYGYKRHNS